MRRPTRAHKFKVGQTLQFTQRRMGSSDGSLICKIVQLLPLEDGEPQYRIKCTSEAVERVVKEHALLRRA
jgi:hypothetical protein